MKIINFIFIRLIYVIIGAMICLYSPKKSDGALLRDDGWLFIKLRTFSFIPLNVFQTTRIDDPQIINVKLKDYYDNVCCNRISVCKK